MMATIGGALRRTAAALQACSDSAELEARLLLAHVLGVSNARLYSQAGAQIAEYDVDCLERLAARRAAGEPVAYITGRCGFWTLEIDVDPAVLIPRPDTETLVETALEILPSAGCAVADLGTGSGAIALALASERPRWSITASDCSHRALACARANAQRLGLDNVRFAQGDWFAPLTGTRFDAIIANPPYVAADDDHLRAPELGYEPVRALVAADHGLADLAHIAGNAWQYLSPGGWVMLEHGCDQAEDVRRLLHAAGLTSVATRPDLAGRPRVGMGQRT